jgi:hypothetical protein
LSRYRLYRRDSQTRAEGHTKRTEDLESLLELAARQASIKDLKRQNFASTVVRAALNCPSLASPSVAKHYLE